MESMPSRSNTAVSSEIHRKTPSLFPCASRVKMPQVGSDETTFKPKKIHKVERSFLRSSSLPPDVKTDFVKRISNGLSFSEDVVKERCFHLLPYSDKYFYDALDYTNLIPKPPKAVITPGRHNMRGSDKRHLPCHIKKRATHQLKPMKRKILEKAEEMNKKAIADAAQKEAERKELESKSSCFLTESEQVTEQSPVPSLTPEKPTKPEGIDQKEWDSYLMSLLSQSTAQWIVKSRLSPGEQRQELEELLSARYGKLDDVDEVELIKDNVSEVDFDAKEEETQKKWRKGEETLLDKVREVTKLSRKPTDPYADDSGAAFYRLPAGFRRAKKYQDREQLGAINQTAHNIQVSTYEAPPPPTLKDYINPKVTTTVYNTDNMFEQEWLTGAKQMYQKDEDPNKILLDTNNKYKKVLQKESPRPPEEWFPMSDKEKEKMEEERFKVKKHDRGLHRWKALPEPIDDTAEKLKLLPPGQDNSLEKAQELAVKLPVKANETLVTIVSDWRGKWHLDMRYADATPEDLIRDMADLHPHIRLKAITTCARAAEYKPPPDPGVKIGSEVAKEHDSNKSERHLSEETKQAKYDISVEHIKLLPHKLFVGLECCLEDENEQVRRAAAVALYALEKPTDKAEEILRACLDDEQSSDRWTAAQCLAYYGECDSDVVGELIKQLLYTEDIVRHEQAGKLLAKLSDNSTLVHSMIAEQLNSSSWRHRVMACQVIPRLKGKLNRDLVNKLNNIMWNDWHHEVRRTVAQTLGRTGHGKEVHDELRQRILSGDERTRVEAVSKVGHLGIMTAKLLPAFLEVFHDNYVSVRVEACVACTNLKVGEPAILDKLVHLATFDPIWRVKALAIQAIGATGVETPAIRECVTWAFRYEEQAGVRAQACHSLRMIPLKDQEVAQMLQDRFLVESSDIVKEQIVEALAMFGISPNEDMDMVAQIKSEVRKLCTRNNVCAHITANDTEDTKKANLERLIYQGKEKTKTEEEETLPSGAGVRPRSQASQSSGSRPFIIITEDRPYSRETSALTPTVDREIQAVTGRHVRGSESRSESARTRITIEDSIIESDEDAVFSESESPPGSQAKSRHSRTKSNTNTNNSGESKPASAVRLSEKQTYVEISGGSQTAGDSRDVVTVTHQSPSPAPSDGTLSRPATGVMEKPTTADTEATGDAASRQEEASADQSEGTSAPSTALTRQENSTLGGPSAEPSNLREGTQEPSYLGSPAREGTHAPSNLRSPAAGPSAEPSSLRSPAREGTLEPSTRGETRADIGSSASKGDHEKPQASERGQTEVSTVLETPASSENEKPFAKQLLERGGFSADGFSSEDSTL